MGMNYNKKRFGYCAVVIFWCFVLQATTAESDLCKDPAEEMMKECLPYMTINSTLTPSVDCCDKLRNITKLSFDNVARGNGYIVLDICVCIKVLLFRNDYNRIAGGSSLPLRCSVDLPFDLVRSSNCTFYDHKPYTDPR
ncbi:hypothetical protein M5689_022839 [Euphorbia peplus]|nr:hypothetical protein M5689_022839 [Euphorbia peplus]